MPAIERLITHAEVRIQEHARERPAPDGFVASDFRAVRRALEELSEEAALPRGAVFCEWGSGFGVVTLIASLLDYSAHGIELQAELVNEAEALAAAHDIEASFVTGSFLPEGADDLVVGQDLWCDDCTDAAYEELGVRLKEIDVFFAYPWPDERRVVESVFERFARPGAWFLAYRGGDVVERRLA